MSCRNPLRWVRVPLRLLLSTLAAWLVAPAYAQPAPLQGIVLQDHRGQPVTPRSLAGRPLLLHFVFTGCSTSCPTQVLELVRLHQALPEAARAQLRVLSVSVDPRVDTPATLADYARRLQADRPGWRFATGSLDQVDRLVDRMAAAGPSRRVEDHRTSIWLYDARGDLVQRYAGVPVDHARLLREISQLQSLAPTPMAPTGALADSRKPTR